MMIFRIPADAAKRFWSGKVADQRYDQILALHFPHKTETLFRGQVAPVAAVSVRKGHQIRVTRPGRSIQIGRRVAQVRPDREEYAVRVLDDFLVIGAQTKLRFNTFEIVVEKGLVRLSVVVGSEQFLGGRALALDG